MKILHSAARPLVLPSHNPLFPLFPKNKKKGLSRKRVNRPESGGGSTALCPRPAAQSKAKGPEPGRGRLGCGQAGQRAALSACHLPGTGAGSKPGVSGRGQEVH